METIITVLTPMRINQPKAWFKATTVLFCLGAATLGWIFVILIFNALR
jgi:hypothetical protein